MKANDFPNRMVVKFLDLHHGNPPKKGGKVEKSTPKFKCVGVLIIFKTLIWFWYRHSRHCRLNVGGAIYPTTLIIRHFYPKMGDKMLTLAFLALQTPKLGYYSKFGLRKFW